MQTQNNQESLNKESQSKKQKENYKEDLLTENRKIATTLDLIAKAIYSQSELMKNLVSLLNSMRKSKANNNNQLHPVTTDDNGNIVMTSYDVPANH